MKLRDIISAEAFVSNLRSKEKEEVLRELSEVVEQMTPSISADTLTATLLKRESLGSTGIGYGVAIPHGKSLQLDQFVAVFGRSLAGVEFHAMDGKPVHLIFLLAGPEKSSGVQLKAMSRISRLLQNETFRHRLMEAEGTDEMRKVFLEEDSRT